MFKGGLVEHPLAGFQYAPGENTFRFGIFDKSLNSSNSNTSWQDKYSKFTAAT